mmetsp:Transcript_65457/g.211038  ORF Transcript_65457/g.211038 Transcript_65457/m.211038 type:complete len:421 (+) Transcript_65457:359-1621(+)
MQRVVARHCDSPAAQAAKPLACSAVQSAWPPRGGAEQIVSASKGEPVLRPQVHLPTASSHLPAAARRQREQGDGCRAAQDRHNQHCKAADDRSACACAQRKPGGALRRELPSLRVGPERLRGGHGAEGLAASELNCEVREAWQCHPRSGVAGMSGWRGSRGRRADRGSAPFRLLLGVLASYLLHKALHEVSACLPPLHLDVLCPPEPGLHLLLNMGKLPLKKGTVSGGEAPWDGHLSDGATLEAQPHQGRAGHEAHELIARRRRDTELHLEQCRHLAVDAHNEMPRWGHLPIKEPAARQAALFVLQQLQKFLGSRKLMPQPVRIRQKAEDRRQHAVLVIHQVELCGGFAQQGLVAEPDGSPHLAPRNAELVGQVRVEAVIYDDEVETRLGCTRHRALHPASQPEVQAKALSAQHQHCAGC